MDVVADPLVERLRAAGCVFAVEEALLLREAAGAAGADQHGLEALVLRRERGEPLEHVVGWVEFCGLRLPVEPGVFVPRRRTELLVQEAVALTRPGSVVVDLCCGNGAVGAAVAAAVELHELVAADLSPAAVRCARRSLEPLGVVADVYEGDLFDALPRRLFGRVDVLLANTPYVPTAEVARLPAEARVHEPLLALDGGRDGLAVQRRVVEGAPDWLVAGGALLVESSQPQADALVEAMTRAGFAARVVEDADLGATVVVGTRSASG